MPYDPRYQVKQYVAKYDGPYGSSYRVFETGDSRYWLFSQVDSHDCDTGLQFPVRKSNVRADVGYALRRGRGRHRERIVSTAHPDPIETWAPLFTKSFSDDQILNPSYMLSQGGPTGIWCKLCDAPAGENAETHVARHTRELKSWRKGRRVEAERNAEEKRTAARQEKELERKVLGTAIPEKRRLANRVTSARYKLKHPEKHGKEKWTKREESELHDTLQAAVKALDDYREKEGKE